MAQGGKGGGGPKQGGKGGGAGRTRAPDGGRAALHTRVKTAKGRKLSSTLWLQRQLNDPYVQRANREGFRSRAAYKLAEIDDQRRFLLPGKRVVDLGCAPGGWLQVAVARVNALGAKGGKARGMVLGVDIQPVDAVEGAEILELDFLAEAADATVKAALAGPADVVLSDMAAASSGHRATDHLRIVALCEAAALFACDVLSPGGVFVAKVLQGGTENDLLALLKRRFTTVAHVKPPASRKDSAEMYVVASGFRPAPPADETGPT